MSCRIGVALRGTLKDTTAVALGRVANRRLERRARPEIDFAPKRELQVIGHADQVEETAAGLEFHNEVEIAVRPIFSARRGAETLQRAHAVGACQRADQLDLREELVARAPWLPGRSRAQSGRAPPGAIAPHPLGGRKRFAGGGS